MAEDGTRSPQEDDQAHGSKDPESSTRSGEFRSTVTVGEAELSADSFRIGQYRILREMGEGGMGTVYLGARADQEFKKHVAIKVIRKGMDSTEIVARFRRERQILASLDHPNIAKLLDGGTTADGLPYFVMEHIQGRPLTEYCDSHKLTTRERLLLFKAICSAVQYAHQNLVIHRDLKPANILVTADGIPKLLDFGIAKLMNPDVYSGDASLTAAEIRVMTPEYASPEQARGDPITTASDVYSLGVILYELLSGRRPYRFTSRNQLEICRVISDEEPEKPSTAITKRSPDTGHLSTLRGGTPEKLRKQLRGDLDNIILLALRKEPQRRYASAEAFSEDIRRYLEGHPVHARKNTWSYRAGKYIRRHKAGVIATSAIFLLLVAAVLTATYQNVRIAEQRDVARTAERRADSERQKAVKVTEFLAELFESNNPNESKGEKLTARQILDRGAERLQKEFRDQPDVQAELMDRVGQIYANLGLFDEGEALIRHSVVIRRKIYGEEHVAVADSLHDLAFVIWEKGNMAEAEKLQREALAIHRKMLGSEDRKVASDLNYLGMVLIDLGRFDEAEQLLREALDIDRRALGKEDHNIAWILGNLAMVLTDKGRLDEAETLLREAIAIDRRALGEESTDVTALMNNLTVILIHQGKLDEAEKTLREVLAIDRKLLGDDNPDVARVLANIAAVLLREGKLDEAVELSRQALVIQRNVLGPDHPDIGSSLTYLGNALRQKGKLDEAERSLREALGIYRKQFGEGNAFVAANLGYLAETRLQRHDPQGAVSLAKEVLGVPIEQLPSDSPYRIRAEMALGAALTSLKRYSEAEPFLLDAYKTLSGQGSAFKDDRQKALLRIIDLYRDWGKPEMVSQYERLTSP